MNKSKIILTSAVFLAGCQFFQSQQVAPAAPPYPTTGAPPVVIGPPYPQGQPMILPGPQPAVVYPPGSTVVPLPSRAVFTRRVREPSAYQVV